jgi:hypothetical protein
MREFEQLRQTWDADALEPISDFIDAADRVVVRFIWRGVGYGPESNMELTGVYTVRNSRPVERYPRAASRPSVAHSAAAA